MTGPVLGDKVKKPATTPAPQPKQIRPGVMQGTDGKFYTNTPLPTRCVNPLICGMQGRSAPCGSCIRI